MTAEDVKRLQVGETVLICDGMGRSVPCVVASRMGVKCLTYRIKGQIRALEIRDWPGKHYKKEDRQ